MNSRLLLAFALLAASCGNERAGVGEVGVWDPFHERGAFEVSVGRVDPGRHYYLTPWFGQGVGAEAPTVPEILGDTRDALLSSVPSRFFIDIDAGANDLVLQTAVRRSSSASRDTFAGSLTCEVFLTTNATLQSLARQELPLPQARSGDFWAEMRARIPAGSRGRLEFVARPADPLGGTPRDLQVAWGNPVVARDCVPETPDVLLVTIDTLRADGLDHAPRLRALLEQGALWERAVAPSNWTLPSYASLFTSSPAVAHRAGRGPFAPEATGRREERGFQPVRADLPTLARLFQRAGYATCMVHQNPLLEPWTGLDRGFDRYVRTRDEVATGMQVARNWWGEHAHRPRFLVLHLMAPHLPYAPPDPERRLPDDPLSGLGWRDFLAEDHTPQQRRTFFDLPETDRAKVRARYYAEVASVDAALAPWLEQLLAQPRPPILGFHSDHGEELWDHGSFEHGHSFQDEVIRVPLAVIAPDLPARGLQTGAVAARDLAPTLLRLAQVPLPEAWRSRGLFDPAQPVRSARPLYRSEHGACRVQGDQTVWEPFSPTGSAEPAAAVKLPPGLQQALMELGYLGAPGASDGD